MKPAMDDREVAPFTEEGIPRTLWWDDVTGSLALIDQTLLPGELQVVRCRWADEVAEAIRTLRVRGAPAIGVAAAYGVALCAREHAPDGARREHLRTEAKKLRATRPTAVTLGWAIDRMLRIAEATPVPEWSARLLAEAQAIAAEDAAACRAMGRFGAELIHDGDTLLTHCNAGALATAGMGTALAPVFTAHTQGKRLHIYVDETRPVLQGARLTAWELMRAGIPMTLISDNMAAHFLKTAGIRGIFVGADRIAANGDVANKIGTYGLAVLAAAHEVPLYVVAPRSTVDLTLASGEAIPIEERDPREVTEIRGVRVAPEGVRVANPAFDVTPAHFIAAIVTEAGVARPPFGPALSALMRAEVAP